MIFQNSVNLQADCKNCLTHSRCVMQSEETPIPTQEVTQSIESETTAFMDTNSGQSIGKASRENDFDLADAVTSAGLSDFLSRPVRVLSFTWSQSDPVGIIQTISPWRLFFDNPNIKYKLNNFAFLRANLHVKVIINASPFYYGSMRASYQPLPAFKTSTVVPGTAQGVTNSELIPYSQQPGLWLKPQTSEGGEMVLPFFYPRSFLKAQSAQDFTDMGTLRFLIYNVLRSANGATGNGASVQVYAWASDVVLAGPSVGLAMQADEYGTGPVSAPASVVASIAGKLKGVPVIGKFATATEMGAKAVAGIAKLFGFTNVPVIQPTLPYRPSPFPQLASPELGYPVEKLTIDAKNELSIDPGILGLPSDDELAIQSFCQRQSFLISSDWTTATTVDTPLFTSAVTPNMGIYSNTVGSLCQYTPLAVLAKLFNAWRGDIIFTFRFIATPFHKGRVRISYDPFNSGVQTIGDTGPTVFNKIVDLGTETEVDVRIPYQQALAWCYTYANTSFNGTKFSTSTTPSVAYTDTFDNGILSVKVLTLLTAPVATSTVPMQVFVRGADNMEFANPAAQFGQETIFTVQAEEYSEVREGTISEMGSNSGETDPWRLRVHFGEVVRSLRPLLRRANFIDAFVPTSSTGILGNWQLHHNRFPGYYGYDPNGMQYAYGKVVPASLFPVNLVRATPWHVIANCFIAQRGAVHWHYNWEGPTPQTIRATRLVVTNSPSVSYRGTTKGSSNKNTNILYDAAPITAGGTSVTNQLTQAGLSVSYPNMTVFKFETTDPLNVMDPPVSGGRYDGSCYEKALVDISTNGVDELANGRLERYFGVGTDYNLHFFLNCPSTYVLGPVITN